MFSIRTGTEVALGWKTEFRVCIITKRQLLSKNMMFQDTDTVSLHTYQEVEKSDILAGGLRLSWGFPNPSSIIFL